MYFSPYWVNRAAMLLLGALFLGVLLASGGGSSILVASEIGTIGSEIGVNDFRISHMGPDGDPEFDALAADVAYNSINDEYLVVWEGDDLIGAEGFEIYAQRVNGTSGALVGTAVRLSVMGPEGDATYDGRTPAVAYNSSDNEYLVVWSGDDNDGGVVEGELEIFGQRLDAAGNPIGADDFRISDMGVNGDDQYDARDPDVAFNSSANQYLVVWHGDDNTTTVDEENEVFGQRLDAAGNEVGANDFRISDMGPASNPAFYGIFPAVVFNNVQNEYLVVWEGSDTGEQEIFGQILDNNGSETGTNDFRISDMGPNGDPNYSAGQAAVAYNVSNDRYLVVWSGDDNSGGVVNDEFEIYRQQLDGASGAEIGGDVRLSDMGEIGSPLYTAQQPAVAYDGNNNEYLVVWRGDDNVGSAIDNEFEIFGQRLDAATGSEITGSDDVRLSDMGPNGNVNHEAMLPAVADNSGTDEALVVWAGDDGVNNEFEIYGQRVALSSQPLPFDVYLPVVVR